jgi:hypothetical protein
MDQTGRNMAQSDQFPVMAGNNTLPRMRRDLCNKPTVRIVENPQQRRPLSLYDNLQQRGGGSDSIGSAAISVGNLADSTAPTTMDRSPSQANCLSTTVPQNIAATNIAGRHTPTRNSLRHSRMIVLSRTGGKGEVSIRFYMKCEPG